MDDPIIDFLMTLSDNEYKSKVREIFDEFDQEDELLADIELTGEIPPSMFDLELNGFSSPVDFEDFLEKNYNSFKISFLSNDTNINLDLVAEINEQIILSKASLIQIKQSKSFSNDITFISIIDLKISYCEKTLSFIKEKYQTIEKQLPNIDNAINDSASHIQEEASSLYVFRIKRDINKIKSKNVIRLLHKELKKYGYIDCSLPQFRQLFTLDEKPKVSSKPIIWKSKTYYTLSYFIKCINRSFLVQSEKPSNYVIAHNLFYSPGGIPFTTSKVRFESKLGKTQEVKAVFDKIMEKCDLIKPTTEKKIPTS